MIIKLYAIMGVKVNFSAVFLREAFAVHDYFTSRFYTPVMGAIN